ncbi:beta-galactosidase [Paenibacillus arenilitoris]|uniref:Beta-galactosidase n=1 Tax=Paenibacillus arenilitoris TaxID=2772299 RepID=A0A927H5G2_9BACL|nr:beta-galactosidase [Paenibacillus arenilitoris]MBD2868503.1 beta-galactosidase [Paenibacillus arenilitoris]
MNALSNKILYGGDYNPEQWPRDVWEEDMRLFKLAGIDIATVNVFSWARNQPDEKTYRFEWLDDVMDMLHANGVRACLGTGTAAHPAWMARNYPDVLTVDSQGRGKKYGRRHNSCPNSPTFRLYAERMARKLAERYKEHPALLLWHVNNEMGWRCYCGNCERAFRVWLRERYGTLDALNAAWYTSFWGHTFYEWEEIVPPSQQSEHFSAFGHEWTAFPAMSIDYDRFNSDSFLACYKLERDAIKSVMPDAVVTTNFQSNGTYKPLDYFRWAKELDVVALDSYPANDTPMSQIAMRHDLMRGLKNGAPFLLMEQSPSQLNWKTVNPLKRPGVMRLWSYQAVARGAEAVMFFQLRRSAGAFEKFHGAVIDHAGHEHTRVFAECAELGRELRELGDTLLGAGTGSKVAIVFDWDNWWALEHSSGPTKQLNYLNQIQRYYDAFYSRNVQVDMIGLETGLGDYDLVIAPVLYMVKPGYAAKLEAYTAGGGTFVTTFFSGIVQETDRVTLGGYPGELRKLLGIWVEEIDPLFPGRTNSLIMKENAGLPAEAYGCALLCERLHTEGAETVAVYGADFYAGMPAITRNRFGRGEAWYIATDPEAAFLEAFFEQLADKLNIVPAAVTPPGVEACAREKDGRRFTFLLNHNDRPETVQIGEEPIMELLSGMRLSGETTLPPHGVLIVEQPSKGAGPRDGR